MSLAPAEAAPPLSAHGAPVVAATVHPLGPPDGAPHDATGLPTRRDEAWRYADLAAVAALWPMPAPTPIAVASGAQVTRTIIADAPLAIHDYVVEIAADGAAQVDILNTGARYSRVTLDVTLGAGASFVLNGVQVGSEGATVEIVTTMRHVAPGATSRQTIRSVLGSRATGSFLGKVAVARAGQQTDAEQSVRAMLLDRTATANAKPELEIYADDVKCAHGAAIGELDVNALFYLASRGLGPTDARALLLEAFVSDVFADEVLADRAKAALRAL